MPAVRNETLLGTTKGHRFHLKSTDNYIKQKQKKKERNQFYKSKITKTTATFEELTPIPKFINQVPKQKQVYSLLHYER